MTPLPAFHSKLGREHEKNCIYRERICLCCNMAVDCRIVGGVQAHTLKLVRPTPVQLATGSHQFHIIKRQIWGPALLFPYHYKIHMKLYCSNGNSTPLQSKLKRLSLCLVHGNPTYLNNVHVDAFPFHALPPYADGTFWYGGFTSTERLRGLIQVVAPTSS